MKFIPSVKSKERKLLAEWYSQHAGEKRYHSERPWDAWKMNFNKSKCKVLHLGQGNPKHKYNLNRKWVECSLQEKDFRVLINENSTWASSVPSQHRKPTVPSTASKKAGPRELKGWFCPSTCPSWDATCSVVFSSRAANTRTTWSCWSRFRGSPEDD